MGIFPQTCKFYVNFILKKFHFVPETCTVQLFLLSVAKDVFTKELFLFFCV